MIPCLALTACGEPKLEIEGKPEKSYYLDYDGKTEKGAKITYTDTAGNKQNVPVDKEKFTLNFPRYTSKSTYTVIAKKAIKIQKPR